MKKTSSFLMMLMYVMSAFLLQSCFTYSEEETPEFFKKQSRNPDLFGVWVLESSYDNYQQNIEMMPNGEYYEHTWIDSRKNHVVESYYYTEGNKMYVLEMGDGFKRSDWVYKYDYRLTDDNTRLEITSSGDDVWSIYKREGAD